jgi:hypothetical protein
MKNGVVIMMMVVSAARQRMREGGGRGREIVVHVGVDGLVHGEEGGGCDGLGLVLAGEERGGHAASREGDVGEAGRVQRDRGRRLQQRVGSHY